MTVADTVVRLRTFGAGGGYRAAGTTHLGLGPQDAAELAACIEGLARRQRETIRLDGSRKLAEIITELRERAGIKRGELAKLVAERTGVKPETVRVLLYKWEDGKVRSPEYYLFDQVMQVLGYGMALVPLVPAPAEQGATAC